MSVCVLVREWDTAYDDLHLRVRRTHDINHLGVRGNDIVRASATENIVRAEHEHDDVGRRVAQPALEIIVGDVDGQPARVTLVALVPVKCLGLAILRVAVLRADVVDLVGQTRVGQLVPNEGTPAGDFGDAVTEGHWEWC